MSKKLTIELTDEQFNAYAEAAKKVSAAGLEISPEAIAKMLVASEADADAVAKQFWKIVKKLG